MHSLLIPARYASKRFPAKMLAEINGYPLLWHTYNKVKDCNGFDEVVALIDSDKTMYACEKHRIRYAFTDQHVKNGTERCAEYASCRLKDDDLVVNVQGDEPLIDPSIPQRILFNLKNNPGFIWTAVRNIKNTAEMVSPDCVKCRVENGFASDFDRLYSPGLDYAHVGVYGYSVARLKQYLESKQTKQEIDLSLEQLRWSEPLACITVEYNGIGVDRPGHLELVKERLAAG